MACWRGCWVGSRVNREVIKNSKFLMLGLLLHFKNGIDSSSSNTFMLRTADFICWWALKELYCCMAIANVPQ